MEDLRRKDFRTRLFMRFLKFDFWLRKYIARRIVRLRSLDLQLLSVEIRLLDDALLQPGESSFDDQVVGYVCKTLLGASDEPALPSQSLTKFVELLQKASTSPKVAEVIERLKCADLMQTQLKEALTSGGYTPFQMGLDPRELKLLDIHLKTSSRRMTAAKAVLIERSALKFRPTLTHVSSVIGGASALLVVGGFIHTWIFYSHFNINVSHFFGATDYVAASVEQLRSAAISCAFSLFAMVAGIRSGSLRPHGLLEIEDVQRARERKLLILLVIICAGLLGLDLISDSPTLLLLPATTLMLAFFAADWISTALLSNPFPAVIAVVAALTFLANVIAGAYKSAAEVAQGIVPKHNPVVILTDSPKPHPGTFLGATSSYIFFISADRRTVHAIPKDKVGQILIPQ